MISRIVAVAAVIVAACPAWADPCTAELPTKPGTRFTGTVRYIVDGDGLCVGESSDPSTWIEVRMVDFDAAELDTPEGRRGKALMTELAMGKTATCEVLKGRSGKVKTFDRVLASCRVEGVSLARLLREAGAPEGGR